MDSTVTESEKWDSRTERLLGAEALEELNRARIFVAGVGGVGGYAAEMLARSGVGHLTLVDGDTVGVTNLNRQIIATLPTIGKSKADLFAERFSQINPDIETRAVHGFITPANIPGLLDGGYDYVIDAIDTVAPKCALLEHCLRNGIRVISSMGAGGRTDPTCVGYRDLWDTRDDGLARAVRQRLKKGGMRRPLLTVSSTEPPRKSAVIELDLQNKRSSFGTIATIPSLFGIFLAAKVLNDLTNPVGK